MQQFSEFVRPSLIVVAFLALAIASGHRLRAENASAGDSALAAAAATAPPAPIDLAATVNGTTVSLAWQAGEAAAGSFVYVIEVGSTPGAKNLFESELAARTRNTSITANDVPFGLYYVRVRARSGRLLSPPSNEVAVRVGCAGPPEPPTGLVAQVAGNLVTLTWQVVSGASSYILGAGSGSGLSDVAQIPVDGPPVSGSAPNGAYYVRTHAVSPCGVGEPSNEVVVNVGGETTPTPTPEPTPQPSPTPPPAGTPIWGMVDPEVLGTCSTTVHDRYVVDGGDGYLYRTWHPQVDPTGCVFGHEHGDDPASIANGEIAASPVRFGYVGRRHPMPGEPLGHEEPHEGFKVFIANPGDVNDEGRVNRVYSRSVFHMGTGGPRRFTMPHHSAEIRLIHPEFGLKAFTQLMMNTGGVGTVCDPRQPAPVKDVVALGSPCRLNSFYEIWSTIASVRSNGREIYRAFATPAVFDPVTVFNPGNPTETVYAWDRRVDAILNFPGSDRSDHRGCDRESYAQPGYWYNGGQYDTGRTTFYTDAMGNEVSNTDPQALEQIISRHYSVSAPATRDGLNQFKIRKDYCGAGLRLKN